jgi:protocatechuate 3,4-dioxygenase beta subunit
MVLVLTTNLQAQSTPDLLIFISETQHQIDELNSIIEKIGRDRIGEVYFERLNEAKIKLIRIKAEPIETKLYVEDINKLYNDIEKLLTNGIIENTQISKNITNVSVTSNGVISGRVLTSSVSDNFSTTNVNLYDQLGNYIANSRVDESGRFAFLNLADGDYIILALPGYYLRNYVTTAQQNIPCIGGIGTGCLIEDLPLISIVQSNILENQNIELAKVSKISGTIANSSDSNLMLESTYLSLYDEDKNRVSGVNVYSDELGEFSINISTPGKYYLKASHSGYSSQLYSNVLCVSDCDFSLATLITVGIEEHVENINFSLIEFTDISGSIIDAGTLVKLDNGNVYLYDEYNYYTVGNSSVNSSGDWTINNIPPKIYTILSESDEYLASKYNSFSCATSYISSCQTIAGTEITHGASQPTESLILKHSQGSTISGKVIDNNNNPITNATIRIYDIDQNFVSINNSYYSSVFTDGDGNFESFVLDNGSYYLHAFSGNHDNEIYPNVLCPDLPCDFSQASLVTISNSQDVFNINFKLNNYSTLTGRIVDSSNSPISNIAVRITSSENQSNSHYNTYDYTNSNGEYHFDRLPKGLYKVYVQAEQQGYYSEIYNNIRCLEYTCQTQTNYTRISLNQSQRNNVNFQLQKQGSVKFNLTSNSSNEVTTGSIDIYDLQNNHIKSFSIDNEIRLPAGFYYFVYKSSSYNSPYFVSKIYGSTNCFSDCISSRGTRVQIRDNVDIFLNMNIDEYFYINVSSDSSSGNLNLYQSDSSYFNYRRNYNNYNIYFNDNLPKRLKIDQQGYYSQMYNNINCLESDCELTQAQLIQPQLNTSIEINYTLKPISTLSGRITDSSGNPIANVSVGLFRDLDSYYPQMREETNANGEYTFDAVEIGNYYLKVYERYNSGNHEDTFYGNVACNSNCSNLGVQKITININDNLNSYDIQMVTKGTISGENIFNTNQEYIPAVIYVYKINENTLNYVTNSNINDDGTLSKIYLSEGSYKFLAITGNYYSNSDERVSSAYPNEICDGFSDVSCAELSSVLTVTNESDTHFNDFVLHEVGKIVGIVYDSVTNEPVTQSSLLFFKNGDGLNNSVANTGNNGEYSKNLSNGDYRIFIENDNRYSWSEQYFDQLYNNVDCMGGLGIDCILADGDIVTINYDMTISINVFLKPKPKLMVRFKDKFSQEIIDSRLVIFDTNKNKVFEQNSYSQEGHLINGLNSGNYSLIVTPRYLSTAYDTTGYPDIKCAFVDSIGSCEVPLTEITLNTDDLLKEVDIYSVLKTGINGYVTDVLTGLPVQDVVVDFWRGNSVVASVNTNLLGEFSHQLNSGNYFISTDTNNAYYDEVYKDYECDYPAILGLCDINRGQMITISDNNTTPIIIDIELSTISEKIYSSSFE